MADDGLPEKPAQEEAGDAAQDEERVCGPMAYEEPFPQPVSSEEVEGEGEGQTQDEDIWTQDEPAPLLNTGYGYRGTSPRRYSDQG